MSSFGNGLYLAAQYRGVSPIANLVVSMSARLSIRSMHLCIPKLTFRSQIMQAFAALVIPGVNVDVGTLFQKSDERFRF